MTNVKRTPKSSTRDKATSWSVTSSPLVPHLAFWTVSLLIKVLIPSALKWLAYDNITTLLLSVWYPMCATISLIHRDKGRQEQQAMDSLQMERQFWLEYWSIGFAGVQFVHRFISLVPSLRQMGRHDYPQLPIVLSEVKLLYFLWIFVMETLLARYQRFIGVDEQKAHWKNFVPLTLLTKAIGPKLMRVQMAVSEQISKETWQRYIKRKAQKVLEVLVLLQFLEVDSMNYLLQLLEEGRSLFLLSIFMVLPSSICEVGMLYPQFIFPSARSLAKRGPTLETLSLKYWVLNNIISLFLSATWWLWWCIPFSNQILLVFKCFVTFPTTITNYYNMVEMDLITFGILSGQAELTVKETKTVQALRALVKRLPRDKHAQSFQFEIDESRKEHKIIDDDSSIGSEDTTESEQERRRKRRREKRAKKKLLKQKKMERSSTTSNSTRPSPLLSESFISRYDSDNENVRKVSSNDNSSDDDERNYSSFINANESESNNTHSLRISSNTLHSYVNDDIVTPTSTERNQYNLCSTESNTQQKNSNILRSHTKDDSFIPASIKAKHKRSIDTEKEQRDARNAAAQDSAFQAEIRHATSFSTTSSENGANNPLSESTKKEKNKKETILSCASDDTNILIPAPSSSSIRENEDEDSSNDLTTNDEDRALLPSMTIGSNCSSSQLELDSKLTNLSIATPTESVVGEVEVRVKKQLGKSKSTTTSNRTATTVFPATNPSFSGSGLSLPLSSSEDLSTKYSMTSLNILSFKSKSLLSDSENADGADSGPYLSDIDTTVSSTIGAIDSFDVLSPASNADKMRSPREHKQGDAENTIPQTTEERNSAKSTTVTEDVSKDADVDTHESPAPRRRSSRLIQLNEWKEKNHQEELELQKKQKTLTAKPSSTKRAKKLKTSTKNKSTDTTPTGKSSTEGFPVKPTNTASRSVPVLEKSLKSDNSSGEKKEKWSIPSPKKTSKKSKTGSRVTESAFTKSTASSVAKRVKKKSSAASPGKSSGKPKGEATSQEDIVEGESTSSPGKTSRKKAKKVPNSRRKKTSVFGGVLSRN